uniref:NADH-ubiquinone oxidoreductase chain 3 n=1 Tax=Eualetes tulipa TaxID=765164 RepID=E2FLU2_9CAEN|nr:NADH dehydrogenase subunit 3 [Eualetes tulipa]ADI79408.1 NADH dehydrogenase subunit 3 [Eualetes tulipa]
MFSTVVNSIVALGLSVVIMFLGFVLSNRTLSDREKKSPFECGFDPVKTARIPFSLRFFLLAIIFLIFDVEIVLLFPIVVVSSCSYTYVSFLGGFMFMFILLLGVLYEWEEGSLDWAQ